MDWSCTISIGTGSGPLLSMRTTVMPSYMRGGSMIAGTLHSLAISIGRTSGRFFSENRISSPLGCQCGWRCGHGSLVKGTTVSSKVTVRRDRNDLADEDVELAARRGSS